ncbi:MAG: hypothetical protein LBD23_01210 [Oscillospiraceae bacterium]|jgi:hypothetical protein|nr:hypothetical protein [Oscillospiraceae bacterium]
MKNFLQTIGAFLFMALGLILILSPFAYIVFTSGFFGLIKDFITGAIMLLIAVILTFIWGITTFLTVSLSLKLKEIIKKRGFEK